MAASGIAEHHEARRKELVYLRKAYLLKEQRAREGVPSGSEYPSGGERPMSTYDQQIYTQSQQGALPGPHDAAGVDAQRRLDHYRQGQQEYSAKIPHRYSSRDYQSQW